MLHSSVEWSGERVAEADCVSLSSEFRSGPLGSCAADRRHPQRRSGRRQRQADLALCGTALSGERTGRRDASSWAAPCLPHERSAALSWPSHRLALWPARRAYAGSAFLALAHRALPTKRHASTSLEPPPRTRSGYIGAKLAELALDAGLRVTLADNWYATRREQLAGLELAARASRPPTSAGERIWSTFSPSVRPRSSCSPRRRADRWQSASRTTPRRRT